MRAALCVILALVATTATAQPELLEPPDTLRVGLALSGGGAKGFAHIGVLKVLDEAGVPIDLIAGTSMGGIVGALYAIGYAPQEIERLVLEQHWPSLLADQPNRKLKTIEQRLNEEKYVFSLPLRGARVELPSAVVDGHYVMMLLSRLTWSVHHVSDFDQFQIPFACIATDLETGEPVRIEKGYLPAALRASMAFPTFVSPFQLEGRTYVDGYASRNLPAQDAREMGANFVIAVDVGAEQRPVEALTSFLDVMNQVSGFRQAEETRRQHAQADLLVLPDVSSYSTVSFNEAQKLIAAGEAAAKAFLPQLTSLAGSARRPSLRPLPPAPAPDSISVGSFQIEGLSLAMQRQLTVDLGMAVPGRISLEAFEQALNRVFHNDHFSRVYYQLLPGVSSSGRHLIVNAKGQRVERLRVGFRFQTNRKASLLFDATLPDLLKLGGRPVAHLRFGEVLELGGTYRVPFGRSRAALTLHGSWTRGPLDQFERGRRITSIKLRQFQAGFSFSTSFEGIGRASIGTYLDRYEYGQDVGLSTDVGKEATAILFDSHFHIDTFDHATFPMEGHRLDVALVTSPGWASADDGFRQFTFNWQARYRLGGRTAAMSQLLLGAGGLRRGLPLHHRYFVGGPTAYYYLKNRQFPLWGYDFNELAGHAMQTAMVGLQWEWSRNLFAQGIWSVARVNDSWIWEIKPSGFVGGYALIVGARTPVGPVEIALAGSSSEGPNAILLNVGYVF